MGFPGYKRPDGGAGVRNHVVVMSSVSCVNGVVNAIGRALPEVKTIVHTEGCGRGLEDVKIASRTLIGLARNPNVYGTTSQPTNIMGSITSTHPTTTDNWEVGTTQTVSWTKTGTFIVTEKPLEDRASPRPA